MNTSKRTRSKAPVPYSILTLDDAIAQQERRAAALHLRYIEQVQKSLARVRYLPDARKVRVPRP